MLLLTVIVIVTVDWAGPEVRCSGSWYDSRCAMLMVVVRMEGGLYRVLLQRTFQSESTRNRRDPDKTGFEEFWALVRLRGRKKGKVCQRRDRGNRNEVKCNDGRSWLDHGKARSVLR